MSKSLEALEELKDEIIPDCALKYEDDEGYKEFVLDLYQTIKQDLEAYVQLKQDHDKTLINNGELCVKVCKLEKENQELKAIIKSFGKVLNIYTGDGRAYAVSRETYNEKPIAMLNINKRKELALYLKLKEVLNNDK